MTLPTFYIDGPVADAIVGDCRARLPDEACGILIGRDAMGNRHVTRSIPAENRWPAAEEATHRYLIDPLTQLQAEREAASNGLMIVGFYHSHPHTPPVPSQTDVILAWPVYTYLIVEMHSDRHAMRAWTLAESASTFQEQNVVVNL